MPGGFDILELSGIWLRGGAPSQIATRQERFSMMNFWDGTHTIVTQEVDGAVGKPDRATLLDLYCGIPLNDPTPPAPGSSPYTPVTRRRRRN